MRARRVRKEVGGWSPFARNDGDCDAVAQALLTAIEHEDLVEGPRDVHDLSVITPEREQEAVFVHA